MEQIKTWLNLPNTSVIVRPVIDLNGNQAVDSYEIPDRIRRHVTERDHHCVFPHCSRPVESCDIDHIEPHGPDGGETSTHNLCPGCRGHHRMKTAGNATYRMLHPGTYHWTLPSGTYLVDPTGTYPLTGSTPPDCPTRPRSSYPAPNPAAGGAIGMPKRWQGSRDGRQSDLLDQRQRGREPHADRNHSSASRDRNHSEHLKQRRTRAGPGGTAS